MNGKVEAPAPGRGASVISPQRTLFPSRALSPSLHTVLYDLSRYFMAGIPLLRWVLGLLLVGGLLWGVARLPGGWWVAGLFLCGWLIFIGAFHYWRRRDFVRFTALPLPTVEPARLTDADKVPVFVTGYLSVENKAQRFTWLPAFYRTFATREHALLCYATADSWGRIGRWLDDEVGLWYLFFQPYELVELRWGTLAFGRTPQPALAITYQRHIPQKSRWQPERTVNEVVYLAVAQTTDAQRIMADLLYDQRFTTDLHAFYMMRNDG
jgi:hypothetical protein